ncbi:hypothetical protein C2E21_9028 [Chlorella sorokiniana]|uniref:Uncharacterized protein n=1 Tax=Chlorella sorokiniana TaxID=3076 RepID=A0A2P6TCL0_CHLSO|nr:hypothetical protein C2E21_9028 [Chlorella sorokiniana]|eukprot:PRW20379.1 hypothetical protein C2E21_9028 [Chlorella sorokiniana]
MLNSAEGGSMRPTAEVHAAADAPTAAAAPADGAAAELTSPSQQEGQLAMDDEEEWADAEQQPEAEGQGEQLSGGRQLQPAGDNEPARLGLRKRRGRPPIPPGDLANRRCLECGSTDKQGRTWMRHAVTKAEWLCQPCYTRSYQPIRLAREAEKRAEKRRLKQQRNGAGGLLQLKQEALDPAEQQQEQGLCSPADPRKRRKQWSACQAMVQQPQVGGRPSEGLALLTAAAEGEGQHSGGMAGAGEEANGSGYGAADEDAEHAAMQAEPAAAAEQYVRRARGLAGSMIVAALQAETEMQAAEERRQQAEGLLVERQTPQHSAPQQAQRADGQLATPAQPQPEAGSSRLVQQPPSPQQDEQQSPSSEQQSPSSELEIVDRQGEVQPPPVTLAMQAQHQPLHLTGAAARPSRDPRRAPAAAPLPPTNVAAPAGLLRRLLSSLVNAGVVGSSEALRYTAQFLLTPAEQQQQELALLQDLAA